MGKVALTLNGKPLILTAPMPESARRIITLLEKLPFPNLIDVVELAKKTGMGRSTIGHLIAEKREELLPYTHTYRIAGMPRERVFGSKRAIAELKQLVPR
jgi:predicted DNA-binding transcriptional regulator AlpA